MYNVTLSLSLISQTIAHEHAFFCVPVIRTGINYNGRVLSTPADGGSIKRERERESVRGSLLQACWIVFWHSLSIVGCGVIVQKWKGGQHFDKPLFFGLPHFAVHVPFDYKKRLLTSTQYYSFLHGCWWGHFFHKRGLL